MRVATEHTIKAKDGAGRGKFPARIDPVRFTAWGVLIMSAPVLWAALAIVVFK